MTRPSRVAALALCLVLAAGVMSACGSSTSGGPDLVKGVKETAGVSNATNEADRAKANGADQIFVASGTPAEVGRTLTSKLGDPGDTVNDAASNYYLYRSGTIWVTEATAPGQSLVAVYKDNDRATSRHAILATNIGWMSTRRGYSSGGGGGSNSGNGFRGGGSGSGK